jgi:hypothetical protein
MLLRGVGGVFTAALSEAMKRRCASFSLYWSDSFAMPDDPVVLKVQFDPNAPEAVEFYRWLGMCVGAWAFVDRRLYQIFHHATGFEQKQSAFIFYRNRAFNQRLRIVDDAVKMAWLAERHENEWKPLLKKTEDLSHTRNIFAHHPTMRQLTAKDGKQHDIYSIYIETYEKVLNNDYPGLRGKTALFVEDLRQHDREVGQLEIELENFAWIMGSWRAEQKGAAQSSPQNPLG